MDIIIPKFQLGWRIRVRFGDGLLPQEFISNDVRHENPKWYDETFGRTIESLEFFLPTGHVIVLKGMESYNFFVEATADMQGGKARIEAFYFCGKLPNKPMVEVWRVQQNKTIVRCQKPFGQEWGGGATSGWKQGLIGNALVSRIVKV